MSGSLTLKVYGSLALICLKCWRWMRLSCLSVEFLYTGLVLISWGPVATPSITTHWKGSSAMSMFIVYCDCDVNLPFPECRFPWPMTCYLPLSVQWAPSISVLQLASLSIFRSWNWRLGKFWLTRSWRSLSLTGINTATEQNPWMKTRKCQKEQLQRIAEK